MNYIHNENYTSLLEIGAGTGKESLSAQSPSFFNLGIGVFVTGLGTVGMTFSGISGIINHRENRS